MDPAPLWASFNLSYKKSTKALIYQDPKMWLKLSQGPEIRAGLKYKGPLIVSS
jgi:hypothetical protein